MSPAPATETQGLTPRGLPAPLPEGERILWQGKPAFRQLAWRAMRLRGIGLYFGALALIRGVDVSLSGGSFVDAVLSAAFIVSIGAVAAGFLVLYAWLSARATWYTLTNRRVILSFGVALPMSMNVPYGLVERADVKAWADGTGDIPFVVKAKKRLSFVLLWPNVRPWRFSRPEPMMRSIPDVERVARLFAGELARVHGENAAAAAARAPGRVEADAGAAPAAPLAPAAA